MTLIAFNLILVIVIGSLIDFSENSMLSLPLNNEHNKISSHKNYNSNDDKNILKRLVNDIDGWTTNSN